MVKSKIKFNLKSKNTLLYSTPYIHDICIIKKIKKTTLINANPFNNTPSL